ncbi:MAG: hypothetical protein U0Q12_18030 [Vicinamibacterales bacterium]
MFDESILRGLRGELLPCGCLVGVYERYTGEVVAIIDAVGVRCAGNGHRDGLALAIDDVPSQRRFRHSRIAPNHSRRSESATL